MTFLQDYRALERKFKDQVKKDNEYFEPKVTEWKDSYYLPNIKPKGPVDFVLVAMEPSDGARRDDGTVVSPRNFIGWMECFILHHCVKHYLCGEGQTHHITDLAKGAMPTQQASKTRQERWPRWYPLLEQELDLVAKPEAPVIAIGSQVENFLNENFLKRKVTRRMGWIPHYSKQATAARSIAPRLHCDEYAEFSVTASLDEIENTAKGVVQGKEFDQYRDDILAKRPQGPLSESSKMLMFTYKKLFAVMRGQSEVS